MPLTQGFVRRACGHKQLEQDFDILPTPAVPGHIEANIAPAFLSSFDTRETSSVGLVLVQGNLQWFRAVVQSK